MLDFRAEAESILLGFFDGRSINVHEQTSSPMVHHHEAAHSRIFHETPDGSIARMLFWLLAEDGERHIPNLKALTRHLVERSRFAHEIAATYIGIKYLQTDQDRIEALATLPEEYQEYYGYFSQTIDGLAESTYLQSALAWSATCCIFSSPTIEKLAPDNRLNLAPLWSQDYNPNERAAALRDWFRDGALRDALAFAYDRYAEDCASSERVPRKLDDLRREQTWLDMRGGSEITYLEGQFTGQSYAWLIAHSPLPSLSSGSMEYGNAVTCLANVLPSERLRFTLAERDIPTFESGHSLPELESIASIQFLSVIHTEPTLKGPFYPEIRDAGFLSEVGARRVRLCFDLDTSSRRPGCHVIIYRASSQEAEASGEPDVIGIFRCNLKTVSDIIRHVSSAASSSSPIECMVVAQSSITDLASSPVYRAVRHADPVIGIYWYDFEWPQLMLRRVVDKIDIMVAVLSGYHSSDIFLNIARVDGVRGHFIKALSRDAAIPVGDYYKELARQNAVNYILNGEEHAAAVHEAAAAFMLALLFWDRI